MVTTVFGEDIIINSSELRNNQKRWFERAYTNPITVRFGAKHLALLNREKVGYMLKALVYVEKLVNYCREVSKGQEADSMVFPWIKYLNDVERLEFYNELLSTFNESINTNDWSLMEYLLNDWEATAETQRKPEIVKELLEEHETKEYVSL